MQYNIAILCRRLYSKYIAKPAQHLKDRVEEIESGKFDEDLEDIAKLDEAKLRKLYEKRDIEEGGD